MVVRINLLPHREEARLRRKKNFHTALALSALGGLAVALVVMAVFQTRIGAQQARNTFLTSEISRLDAQIKEIATLESDIAMLRAHQGAVEALQADRNSPVHLLNELVRQLPDGVYLTSLKQSGQTVTLTGQAQSNERVSELLRNLGNRSAWLYQPQLAEIVAATTKLSERDQRRTASFRLTVQVRPEGSSDEAPSAGAAKPQA